MDFYVTNKEPNTVQFLICNKCNETFVVNKMWPDSVKRMQKHVQDCWQPSDDPSYLSPGFTYEVEEREKDDEKCYSSLEEAAEDTCDNVSHDWVEDTLYHATCEDPGCGKPLWQGEDAQLCGVKPNGNV